MEKKKEPLFSEQIDSRINGLAIVFAFLALGILLLVFPNYFGSPTVTKVMRWIFIAVGGIGLCAEFSGSKSSPIKGTDDFLLGIFMLACWFAVFRLFHQHWMANTIGVFFLIIGAYGLFRGLMEMGYSAVTSVRQKQESRQGVFADLLLLLTKVASLALVVMQLVKAIRE